MSPTGMNAYELAEKPLEILVSKFLLCGKFLWRDAPSCSAIVLPVRSCLWSSGSNCSGRLLSRCDLDTNFSGIVVVVLSRMLASTVDRP